MFILLSPLTVAPQFAPTVIAIVLTQHDPSDLILLGAIFGIAGLYYVLYLRPRSATHWVMLNPTVPGDPAPPTGTPVA